MDVKVGMDADYKLKAIIVLWVVFLVVFYSSVGVLGVIKAEQLKAVAFAEHDSIVNPYKTEPGKTRAAIIDGPVNGALSVKSGMYIERITDLVPKESTWTVDFYIWFRWRDMPGMPDVNPGESFQVIDGAFIVPPVQIDAYEKDGEHYALYRAKAKVTKFFDMSRFPRDDHMLTLRIEDKRLQYADLKYVADREASSISSRVELPGYVITKGELIEKPHSYKTNRGNPLQHADYKDTHSQLLYAIMVHRPGWGLYLKLFQGMFAAMCISLLAFMVRPTERPRFSLGIGAFFASVASTYITSNQLPGVDILTLTDVVNGVGMSTIFFTLVSSIISLYLFHVCDRQVLSKLFDRICLAVFFVGIVAVNAAVVSNAAL